MGSRVVLLANPAAGSFRQDALDRVIRLIRERGLSVEVLTSQVPGDVTRIAERSRELSPEMVFILGGDGTFNEAVNGLIGSAAPVAFLPQGTVNVLAGELGIPRDPRQAAERAMEARPRTISLGKVVIAARGPRYFILMAGAGFDADAVLSVDQGLKRAVGRFAYLVSGLRVFARYRSRPIQVRSAEKACTGYAVIVGKASRYGGNFSVTPDASLFDPSLRVFVLTDPGRAAVVRAAFGIVMKRQRVLSGVEYFMTDSVVLDGDVPVQVDGEYLGTLPASISVERDCLRILA